jgi:hypothetical protein
MVSFFFLIKTVEEAKKYKNKKERKMSKNGIGYT